MAKVLLIKTYIDRLRGNLYPASPLPIDELLLPPEIRNNPEYVRPVDNPISTVPADDTEIQTVELDQKIDGTKPNDVGIETKAYVSYSEAEEALNKININKADFDELIKIPHVGKAIANKIIQERNKAPFESIDDVTKRVPTKFGIEWSQFITVQSDEA